MKQVDELMDQIADAMSETAYFDDFRNVLQKGDSKKTFLWLDEKWRNDELPAELETLLTDLFFMLH